MNAPAERLILEPGERREAVLQVIRGARERLVLSVFRCDDFKILDALAGAVRRGVRVRALLTQRAKNWDKRLQELEVFLDSMGAEVHRYAGAETKYHAKYIVADDGPALIASLNFTRKCFEKTCDFIVVTCEPGTVAGLTQLFENDCRHPDAALPPGFSDRLIVGPDRARTRFLEMLGQARRSHTDHRPPGERSAGGDVIAELPGCRRVRTGAGTGRGGRDAVARKDAAGGRRHCGDWKHFAFAAVAQFKARSGGDGPRPRQRGNVEAVLRTAWA